MINRKQEDLKMRIPDQSYTNYCYLCQNTGRVFKKDKDGYEYAYRCRCVEGKKYQTHQPIDNFEARKEDERRNDF